MLFYNIDHSSLLFYEKVQNSSFLIISKVKMDHILPRRKNFLYGVLYMANYQKIYEKFKKCGGKISSFLPWTQDLNWILTPSFYAQIKNLCTWQYNFKSTFDFGTKQKLCLNKSWTDVANSRNHIS